MGERMGREDMVPYVKKIVIFFEKVFILATVSRDVILSQVNML